MILALFTSGLLALTVAVPSTFAAPAPEAEGSSSSSDNEVCRTKYIHGTESLAGPLPSYRHTKVHSITKTITGTVPVSEETVLITPNAVTETTCVDASPTHATASMGTGSAIYPITNATRSTVTVTSWVNKTMTFVTDYTSTLEVCTETTTITGNGVATVYTGDYSSAVAKRTASPMDRLRRDISLLPRDSAVGFSHYRGNDSWRETNVPAEINCMVHATERVRIDELTTNAIKTTTLTAATPTITVTYTETDGDDESTASASAPVTRRPRTITTTSTTTIHIRTGAVFTTEVDCTVTPTGSSGSGASSTLTQNLACAPTNLISSANGYSIEAVMAQSNVSAHLSYASTASDCCQQCFEEDDCAASAMDPDAWNCFLYLVDEGDGGECGGLAFTYSDEGKNRPAGSGMVVQAGCGIIKMKGNVASNIMRMFES